MKLAPSLRKTHPGYFKVVLSVLVMHAAMAIDALRTRSIHNSLSWKILDTMVGGHAWAYSVIHVACAIFILVGLYRPAQFWLARLGLGLSVVLLNTLAVGFFMSAVAYDTTVFSAIACVALSLCSTAAVLEPTVQPLYVQRKL